VRPGGGQGDWRSRGRDGPTGGTGPAGIATGYPDQDQGWASAIWFARRILRGRSGVLAGKREEVLAPARRRADVCRVPPRGEEGRNTAALQSHCSGFLSQVPAGLEPGHSDPDQCAPIAKGQNAHLTDDNNSVPTHKL